MSEYTAIRGISESLRVLLNDAITEPGVNVFLQSPKEMREEDTTGVSLWLYRITRNEHLLNQPAPRPAPNQIGRKPIPVNLHYLITPLMSEPVDEQILLGRILQIFNDDPVLRGSDLQTSLEGSHDEFRVFLETLSLEDLTRIWSALQEPYQASISYLVQTVNIEAQRPPTATAPVTMREMTTSQIVEVT